MSLDDDLAQVNAEYAKMDLKTPIDITTGGNAYDVGEDTKWVSYEGLLRLLLETYQQAIEIGWETKALDSLTTKIREAK